MICSPRPGARRPACRQFPLEPVSVRAPRSVEVCSCLFVGITVSPEHPLKCSGRFVTHDGETAWAPGNGRTADIQSGFFALGPSSRTVEQSCELSSSPEGCIREVMSVRRRSNQRGDAGKGWRTAGLESVSLAQADKMGNAR